MVKRIGESWGSLATFITTFLSLLYYPPVSTMLSEIRSFLSIFLTANSFLSTNTHPPNTCSHLRYDLTTCSLPLISFRFHHSHQVQTFAHAAESIRKIYRRQELSTREALRQAPSPTRSRIARLRRWTASTPTPPRTRDAILYHKESSPRGLPTSTIPHDGMKTAAWVQLL